MAPEIIDSRDFHSPPIDWWAIGCIIYELIVGIPPFNAPKIEIIWENIRNRVIEWPEVGYGDDCITPEAKDLIERLLTVDVSQRMQSLEEIKAHPFFAGRLF